MTDEFSLAWLIAPISVEEFVNGVWAQRTYLVRRSTPDYFDRLFDEKAVEEFLEFRRPAVSSVSLVSNDHILDPEIYRLSDGEVDLVRVRNKFADGYTVVLNALQRYIPTIALLAQAIEAALDFETFVNAYVTPPGSQGFAAHYDDHDVLILQIRGSKLWHIYEPPIANHELRMRKPLDGTLSAPQDHRISAGDVLYVPRGQIHAAHTTSDGPSIHLTVGIHAPTVLTLITEMLEALSYRDDRALACLNPGFLRDPAARAGLVSCVRDVLNALDEPRSLGEGLGALQDVLIRRGRHWPSGQLVSNPAALEQIDGQTEVVRSPALHSRVLPVDGGFALQFAQSLVSASPDHRAALLFLSNTRERFRVDALPGLSPALQIELARKLLLDGFLIRE